MLANLVNKDIWINTPITASGCLPYPTLIKTESETSSYIYQLALLLKNGNNYTSNKGLVNNLKVYIEHSNEVWNFGFGQYTWNKLNAIDCVKHDSKIPIAFNSTDQEVWAR